MLHFVMPPDGLQPMNIEELFRPKRNGCGNKGFPSRSFEMKFSPEQCLFAISLLMPQSFIEAGWFAPMNISDLKTLFTLRERCC